MRDISVIIPVYNSGSSAIIAIQSVIGQAGHFSFSIVIIDDGSTDDSVAIITEYLRCTLCSQDLSLEQYGSLLRQCAQLKSRLIGIYNDGSRIEVLLVSQRNGGPSSARNLGILLSRAQYLSFLDSDDTWHCDKTSIQISFLRNNVEIDAIGAVTDQSTFRLPNRLYKSKVTRIVVKDLLKKCYFQPSTVIMKAHIVSITGGFPEGRSYAEDGDFFLRIAAKFHLAILPIVLVSYSGGKSGRKSGLSSNMIKMELGELSNFYSAFRRGDVGFVNWLIYSAYSIVKFFRRFILFRVLQRS